MYMNYISESNSSEDRPFHKKRNKDVKDSIVFLQKLPKTGIVS